MKKLFLLFALTAGMVWAQENDSIQAREGMPKEKFDSLMNKIQGVIDDANKLLESQMKFKAIDLNSLDKKERKDWVFNHDKFKEVTFVKYKVKYMEQNYDFNVYPYIVVNDDGYMYMRLKARYNGRDWVFFDKITFLIGDEKYEFTPTTTSRDVSAYSGVSVYEYSDTSVDTDIYNILQKIANSTENIDYRFSGSRGHKDETLKERDINRIKKTLDFFERLKAE